MLAVTSMPPRQQASFPGEVRGAFPGPGRLLALKSCGLRKELR
jgi:hypothetical protein